ncbi:MAG: prolyl oligopeptidase family serine peptidase [Halobacteriaceae archaeon]
MPIDTYYDISSIQELSLSPNGDRVAYTVTDQNEDDDETVTSLFVAPTDGSKDPYRLTRASEGNSPKWSPDGSRLAFLATREEDSELAVTTAESEDEDESEEEDTDESSGSTEEEPETQVWMFNLDRGGDARQVTTRDHGVREFDWGPNGDRIVISARDPTDEEEDYLDQLEEDGPIEIERLKHKANGVGYLDSVTSYLFVIDLDTREERRLDEAYGGGANEPLYGLQPTWNPEGDTIAFLSLRTDRPDDSAAMDIYTITADGNSLSKVTDSNLRVSDLEWGPTGDALAFVAGDPENGCIPSQVYLYDGQSYESLTEDVDRRISWRGGPRWVTDQELITPIADDAQTRLLRVNTDGTTERIFDGQGDYYTLQHFDLRNETAGLLLTNPQDGQDIYTIDVAELDGGSFADLRQISAINDSFIDEYPMPQCKRIAYQSEGTRINGIVYAPQDFDFEDPDRQRPLIVSIHGGPLSYDSPEFSFAYSVFTSRGYLVLCPNYRGGASRGRAFAEELRGAWGTKEVTDIVAGVNDLIDRNWANKDRVFGHGFSYGGIAQGFLIAETDIFTAAAPEHGIYDLRSAYGTDDTQVYLANEFGLPWEDPETYERASSITEVGNVETPILVTAGDSDWRCPPSQAEQLYVSVKKQGVDAKLIMYQNEHHNIGDPDRAIHRLEEILNWYESHDPERDS